jgi:predicted tellurium resistance membrane protein TerC
MVLGLSHGRTHSIIGLLNNEEWMMSSVVIIVFLGVFVLFIRAVMITLGYYKEPVLAVFQQYGEEVGFSPMLTAIVWGIGLAYMLFFILVPSAFWILFGALLVFVLGASYWYIKDNIMRYPQLFLQYPRWYRDIVDHTTRDERRKIAYMWLGLPMRTRMLYNTRDDAFRQWVELVVISVAVRDVDDDA